MGSYIYNIAKFGYAAVVGKAHSTRKNAARLCPHTEGDISVVPVELKSHYKLVNLHGQRGRGGGGRAGGGTEDEEATDGGKREREAMCYYSILTAKEFGSAHNFRGPSCL